jgi:uncharacterized membrane protein
MIKHEWLLKRNCSLSPRQSAWAFATPCLVSFALGLLFALHGTWVVFAFAMLEAAGVALAFFHYARHATDREHIALIDDCLLIERIQAGQVEQTRLNPYWTRIVLPRGTQDLIKLEAKGVKIAVGRFVSGERRQQVAQELRQELRGGLFAATSKSFNPF